MSVVLFVGILIIGIAIGGAGAFIYFSVTGKKPATPA